MLETKAMKRLIFNGLGLLVLAGSLAGGNLSAQDSTKAMVPVRPSELLKSLPAAPAGWKVTHSVGEDLPDVWPKAKAVREYILEIPNPTGQGPAIPVEKIQLIVVDTAGQPGSLRRFAPPVPGEERPPGERIQVGAMPAIRKPKEGQKERVDALALDRFLLVASVEPLSPPANAPLVSPPKMEKPEDWIQKFNVEILRNAPKSEAKIDVEKDHSMLVERIDELNPAQSSKSTWTFSVEDQLQAK